MLIPIAVLPIVLAAATPAIDGESTLPKLQVDPAVFLDDTVLVIAAPMPTQIISQTIWSPPVDLYVVTRGLVSGSTGENSRDLAAGQRAAADLTRTAREIFVGTLGR